MSSPANPLDIYRSYSYHHFLAVSNTSEDIASFVQLSQSGHAMASISGAKLGEPIPGTQNVYLVCDTSSLSHFAIKEVNFISGFSGGDITETQVMYGTLNMIVQDDTTIGLMNYLRFIVDKKLGSDFNGLIFLLKTVFIGHTYEGKTTTYEDAAVIPMILQNLDFELSQSSAGYATYTFSFVPMNNAAIAIRGEIGERMNYDVSTIKSSSGLLKDCLKDYQDQVNKRAREYYYKNISQRNADGTLNAQQKQESSNTSGVGRLVQIRITMPPEWEKFTVDGVKSKMEEINHKAETESAEAKKAQEVKAAEATKTGTTAGTNPEIHHTITPSMNPTQVIQSILSSSDEVQKLTSIENVQNGMVKQYKILSGVTSDSKSVMYHYNIIEYSMPNPSPNKAENEKSAPTSSDVAIDSNTSKYFTKNANGILVPKNGYIYDYTFSGKNTDILNLVIGVKNAFQGLMKNIVASGSPGTESKQYTVKDQKKDTTDVPLQVNPNQSVIRENDVQLLPVRTSQERKNFSNITPGDKILPKTLQETIGILADLHGFSEQETKVTIRGNPSLMMHTIHSTVPKHIAVDTTVTEQTKDKFINDASNIPDSKTEYDTDYLNQIYADNKMISNRDAIDSAHSPIYVTLNIYGPNIATFAEWSTGEKPEIRPDVQPYAIKYWYDDWYLLREINHRFVEGRFEQDLNLLPFSIYKKHLYGLSMNSDVNPNAAGSTISNANPSAPQPGTTQPTTASNKKVTV